ncbi:hypothetical protein [Azospira sp. I09]|uniref:hypothetical protein n=1 Tax=Azospira sp. I09 TaxID=1765049 RepID=UPI00126080E5|nr:hypothetical protein [Azospira sp. I09]BBN90719.1 hypothetical protein AZSP09_37420 [Azospira sp. I09]
MVHHLGIGVVGAALLAAILAPAACNPLKSKEDTQAPIAQVQADAATSQSVEDAARLYLTDLYSKDPARVRRALLANAGSVGVSDAQVAAAVADNQAKPTPKEIVIVRQEVQHMPPQGHSASVWFVLVRPDATTQTGRLAAWRRHGGSWTFTLAGY